MNNLYPQSFSPLATAEHKFSGSFLPDERKLILNPMHIEELFPFPKKNTYFTLQTLSLQRHAFY